MTIILSVIIIELALLLYFRLTERKKCGCNGLYACREHSKQMSDIDEELKKGDVTHEQV